MNFTKSLLIASVLTIASPALCETAPSRGKYDSRITYAKFKEGEVYTVSTRLRNVTLVELADGEKILSISVGDSASFNVDKLERANVFVVKPLIAGASTNMTVETNRRYYFLRLTESRSRLPQYSLKFTANSASKTAARKEVVPPATPMKYQLHPVKEKIAFKPIAVWDDGHKTYFKFKRSAPIPAVFKADASGNESVVNSVTNGRIITVTGRSTRFVLRKDDLHICINGVEG